MPTWKRDVASGLVVLLPIALTIWVVFWLFSRLAALGLVAWLVEPQFFGGGDFGLIAALVVRVLLTLVVLGVVVLSIGYLMRTALGTLVEETIDDLVNRLPGLRVVYNASKMAVETALSGTEELQTPVKLETWNGIRMTAFKTGKTTDDGREVLFLPTAPNITTGFVIEVESDRIEETDERVEDALTRILSAGFGDTDASARGIAIDVIDEKTAAPADGGTMAGSADEVDESPDDAHDRDERPVEADGGADEAGGDASVADGGADEAEGGADEAEGGADEGDDRTPTTGSDD